MNLQWRVRNRRCWCPAARSSPLRSCLLPWARQSACQVDGQLQCKVHAGSFNASTRKSTIGPSSTYRCLDAYRNTGGSCSRWCREKTATSAGPSKPTRKDRMDLLPSPVAKVVLGVELCAADRSRPLLRSWRTLGAAGTAEAASATAPSSYSYWSGGDRLAKDEQEERGDREKRLSSTNGRRDAA